MGAMVIITWALYGLPDRMIYTLRFKPEISSGEAIQFSPDLFPSSLLNLPDYAHISELLSKSQYGIRFYDEGLYDELLEMIYVLLLQDDSDSFDIFWNSDEPVPGTRK